jgi:hypothetical protein
MERVTFESVDNDYAYDAFMTLIFKKQFLERFEAPLVRLIKYHFVLYTKGKLFSLVLLGWKILI